MHHPDPTPKGRILLVDDDRKLARLLADFLSAGGLSVECAHDGLEGLERARSEPWDAVLLDVMLPRLDGFSILKALRQGSTVPVLMLTARGAEAERIQGLEGGADDYLPKTVSARELLARVRALLRRAGLHSAPEASSLSLGALCINVPSHTASWRGEGLSLTPVEFDLLLALAQAHGEVRTREQLLPQLRDRSFDGLDRSIDVHIGSLRRKLGDDPRAPAHILTVRGLGYRLAC